MTDEKLEGSPRPYVFMSEADRAQLDALDRCPTHGLYYADDFKCPECGYDPGGEPEPIDIPTAEHLERMLERIREQQPHEPGNAVVVLDAIDPAAPEPDRSVAIMREGARMIGVSLLSYTGALSVLAGALERSAAPDRDRLTLAVSRMNESLEALAAAFPVNPDTFTHGRKLTRGHEVNPYAAGRRKMRSAGAAIGRGIASLARRSRSPVWTPEHRRGRQ